MVKQIIVGMLGSNCYLYSAQAKASQCIIIDPGADEARIAAELEASGVRPSAIALTHGHLDHIAAAGRLVCYFADRGIDLCVAIHSGDRDHLGTEGVAVNRRDLANLGLLHSDEAQKILAAPLPEAGVELEQGQKVFDTDLTVIETPGHSPGSVCFYSETNGVLFSGDTLFCEGIGRYDIPGGDGMQLLDNIKNKLFRLPPDTRVFPGHGPSTTIGHELTHNPFLRGAL